MKRKVYPHPLPHTATTVVDAKRELDGPPDVVKFVDWSQRRAPTGSMALIEPATTVRIDALPAKVQPHELAIQCPRIANRICGLWDEPTPCTHYLNELMIVRRKKRQGFPAKVVREVGGLAIHYAMLHRMGRAWM